MERETGFEPATFCLGSRRESCRHVSFSAFTSVKRGEDESAVPACGVPLRPFREQSVSSRYLARPLPTPAGAAAIPTELATISVFQWCRHHCQDSGKT